MAQYFVSDADLVRMRADVARMLPDTCIVKAPVRVYDAAGRGSLSYQAMGTIACRVGPPRNLGQGITTIAGKEALLVYQLLTVAYNSTLLAADRQVEHNGLTYEIRGLVDDHSWNVSKQAYIVRIA